MSSGKKRVDPLPFVDHGGPLHKAGRRAGVIPSPETQAAIRKLRLERDLTYEAVGTALGVSRNSAWKGEQGKPVYDRVLFRIERALLALGMLTAPASAGVERRLKKSVAGR